MKLFRFGENIVDGPSDHRQSVICSASVTQFYREGAYGSFLHPPITGIAPCSPSVVRHRQHQLFHSLFEVGDYLRLLRSSIVIFAGSSSTPDSSGVGSGRLKCPSGGSAVQA